MQNMQDNNLSIEDSMRAVFFREPCRGTPSFTVALVGAADADCARAISQLGIASSVVKP